jgi:uncharacterized protein
MTAPARVVLAVLSAYRRWLSPLLGQRCRFMPSCSQYAVEAITEHGLGRGGLLALRRLSRCHPFHRGGYDPVPAKAARA